MSYRKKSEGVAHVVEHLSSKNDTPELQKKTTQEQQQKHTDCW
jgi:hypothetical protein